MGHRPELLAAWEDLKHALLGPSSTLSPELKEEVRRTLAQRTGCQFCASLGQPAEDHETRSESLAVAFADMVALDHTAISDAKVKLLLDEFTVPEVVELLMWISFEYAGQMFGCLIGDEPATAEAKDAFAASVARSGPARPSSATRSGIGRKGAWPERDPLTTAIPGPARASPTDGAEQTGRASEPTDADGWRPVCASAWGRRSAHRAHPAADGVTRSPH